jgi:hypothetical protein
MPTLVSDGLIYPLIAISGEALVPANEATKALYHRETKLMWILTGGHELVPLKAGNRESTEFTPTILKANKPKFHSANGFVSSVNQANWGGFSDWRLPSIAELQSLARLTRAELQNYFCPYEYESVVYLWSNSMISVGSERHGVAVNPYDAELKAFGLGDLRHVVSVRDHSGGVPKIRRLNKGDFGATDCPF